MSRTPYGAVSRASKGRAAFLAGSDPYYMKVRGVGDQSPGASCDNGVLRTINFQGHNIQICRQHFDDALNRAKYNYINDNNLWPQGCIRDGIYVWPAVSMADYSTVAAPASVVAAAKATYPSDHGGTIYVFGAGRDDSCDVIAPFNPFAAGIPTSQLGIEELRRGRTVMANVEGANVPVRPAVGGPAPTLTPVGGTDVAAPSPGTSSGYTASTILAAAQSAGPLGIPLWGWGAGLVALGFAFMGGRR